ncbi:hypothetical protein SALBM135S_04994 [Streptomyces alboniger]
MVATATVLCLVSSRAPPRVAPAQLITTPGWTASRKRVSAPGLPLARSNRTSESSPRPRAVSCTAGSAAAGRRRSGRGIRWLRSAALSSGASRGGRSRAEASAGGHLSFSFGVVPWVTGCGARGVGPAGEWSWSVSRLTAPRGGRGPGVGEVPRRVDQQDEGGGAARGGRYDAGSPAVDGGRDGFGQRATPGQPANTRASAVASQAPAAARSSAGARWKPCTASRRARKSSAPSIPGAPAPPRIHRAPSGPPPAAPRARRGTA